MLINGVFEGGGVKALAFVGAIEVVEDYGYQWNRLAGTSAGAIVASMLAAGYGGKDLNKIINQLQFEDFLKKDGWNRIPYAGNIISLWFRYGMHTGDFLNEWVYEILARKNIYTFNDLPEGSIKIVASDITNGRMLVLPDDISLYDLDPKQLLISQAVRMSCSLPYYFQPVIVRHGQKKIFIVDGGILSKFPVWIFDQDTSTDFPTLGFKLSSKQQLKQGSGEITNPFIMYRHIVRTMINAHDLMYIEKDSARRTIFIPTGDISSTDFNLSSKEKKYLYQSGQKAAKKFLSKWSIKR